jgi:hypothetical protein
MVRTLEKEEQTMITFGDSGPKPQDIPYDHAALYSDDCDYPCPPDVAAKWPPVNRRWITFTGMYHCSIADFEPGTKIYESPSLLRGWARARERNQVGLSIVYCDLSNVKKALDALGKVPRVWWLATLDGVQTTAEALSQRLKDDFGVTVPASQIYGNQWQAGATYDTSDCYGDWR